MREHNHRENNSTIAPDFLLIVTRSPSKKRVPMPKRTSHCVADWSLVRERNKPDKSLHQPRTAMHHHSLNQERTINPAILTMSGSGKFPRHLLPIPHFLQNRPRTTPQVSCSAEKVVWKQASRCLMTCSERRQHTSPRGDLKTGEGEAVFFQNERSPLGEATFLTIPSEPV